MKIAIDGTAASGKGTLSYNLSKELKLPRLDTGLLYRKLAFLYIKSAKLNNLSGTLIFFSNNKSEIKNIDKLLSSSSNNLFKKNLKNNK